MERPNRRDYVYHGAPGGIMYIGFQEGLCILGSRKDYVYWVPGGIMYIGFQEGWQNIHWNVMAINTL